MKRSVLWISFCLVTTPCQSSYRPAAGLALSILLGFAHGVSNTILIKQGEQHNQFISADARELTSGLVFLGLNEMLLSTLSFERSTRMSHVIGHGCGQLLGELVPFKSPIKPIITLNIALFWGLAQKARAFLLLA